MPRKCKENPAFRKKVYKKGEAAYKPPPFFVKLCVRVRYFTVNSAAREKSGPYE